MDPPLLTLPVELLSRVWETCDDFPQVLALASTCKRLHRFWVTHAPSIIWSVARLQIPAFDDALMAVRATAMVLKAYKAGTAPPVINPIGSLGGNSRLPDLDEVKEVMNMQYLVRCLEHLYFYSSQGHEFDMFQPPPDHPLPPDFPWDGVPLRYPAERRRFPNCLKENIPGAENATIESFRAGFYRAMYRLLLAGAVLAGAYMHPLFRARDDADLLAKIRFFTCWGDNNHWWEGQEELGERLDPDPTPKDADFTYIRQSPVYNFDMPDWSEIGQWRDREYQACFGPFASWIVNNGRKREQHEPHGDSETNPDWAQSRADVGAVRELMLLLVASDHLNHHFRDFTLIPYMQKPGNKTVTIVRFGVFQVEKITMPAALEDLTDTFLHKDEVHPALMGTAGEGIPFQFDVDRASWELSRHSRSPIPRHWEHPGPRLELEFWNFTLKSYLGLTFKAGTFWAPQLECKWWREVGRGDIFLNPNWAIVQKYQPGAISWDYRNNWSLH